MADFSTNLPTVQYDPESGMRMLSGIMGIKAKQLDIQAGKIELQRQQQLQGERQRITQMMTSGQDDQGNSILNENGEPDPAKVVPAIGRIAPLSGQQYAQNIIKTATDKVGLQESSRALDVNHRNALMGIVQSVAAGQSPDDAKSAVRNYVDQHPEAGATANYLSGFIDHISNAKDPKQRAHMAQSLASMFQPGQTVPTLPQAGTNAAGQATNRTPITGAVSLAPTESAGPSAGGGGTAGAAPALGANPSAPQVAAQTAASQGASAGITARVQQAQSAANNTPQSIDALERARILLDDPQIRTGTQFTMKTELRNALAGLGINLPETTNANELVKNLARYEAMRATQAGLGGTDAARDLAHNGSPHVDVDQNALQAIVTQSLATERAIASYSNVQAKHAGDANAQTRIEGQFRGIPHLIQGYEYGLMRNPAEADAYLKSHGLTAKDMAGVRGQIKQFEGQ